MIEQSQRRSVAIGSPKTLVYPAYKKKEKTVEAYEALATEEQK